MKDHASILAMTTVKTIVRNLGSKRAVVRAKAADDLSRLTDGQVDALVRLVRANDIVTRSSGPQSILSFLLFLFALMALPTLSALGFGGILPPLLMAAILGGIAVSYPCIANPRFRRSVVRSAILANDSRLLGPLLMISCIKPVPYTPLNSGVMSRYGYTPATAEDAQFALAGILERLDANDRLDVSAMEKACLSPVIKHNGAEFVLRLMPVVEAIGGSQELQILTSLEAGKYSGSESQAVREAATHCRLTIESRIAHQSVSSTLLRASDISASKGELVRPALAAARVEGAVLVRPALEDL